mgnify:CR=1 FL=1|jgi:hypothetical protein
MYPQSFDWHQHREGMVYLSAPRRSVASMDGMVSIREGSINIVNVNKPKALLA